MVKALQEEYVSPWYIVVLAGFIIIPLYHTVKAGNEMTHPIRAIYNLGNWLAEKF